MPQVVQLRGNGRSGSALAENQLLMRNLENNVADNVKRKALQLQRKNELEAQFAAKPYKFSGAESTINEFGGETTNQRLRDALALKRNDLSQQGYDYQTSETTGYTPEQEAEYQEAQNRIYNDPTMNAMKNRIEQGYNPVDTNVDNNLKSTSNTLLNLKNSQNPVPAETADPIPTETLLPNDVQASSLQEFDQKLQQNPEQYNQLLQQQQVLSANELIPQKQQQLIEQPANAYNRNTEKAKVNAKVKSGLNVDYQQGSVTRSGSPGVTTTRQSKANIIDENPYTYESQAELANYSRGAGNLGRAYGGSDNNQLARNAEHRAGFVERNQGLIGVERQEQSTVAPEQKINVIPNKASIDEFADTQSTVEVGKGAFSGGGGAKTKSFTIAGLKGADNSAISGTINERSEATTDFGTSIFNPSSGDGTAFGVDWGNSTTEEKVTAVKDYMTEAVRTAIGDDADNYTIKRESAGKYEIKGTSANPMHIRMFYSDGQWQMIPKKGSRMDILQNIFNNPLMFAGKNLRGEVQQNPINKEE